VRTVNPPRRRRWPKVLGVIAVLLVPAYWWLFIQVPGPDGSWTLDLAEVRRLAGTLEGDKPTELRVERVGEFKFPYAVIHTGGSWSLRPMTMFAYQLVFPTHTAIVDTAENKTVPGGTMDTAAFERVTQALPAADLIVVTHEHSDHLGGLATHPKVKDLLKVARLNRDQLADPDAVAHVAFPPGALEGYAPLEYDKYVAVAPGVVLIRAAGHTRGSQMVYVQRADGTEVLFLGDVAWAKLMVDEVAERPRVITGVIAEDRPRVLTQLQVLKAVAQAEPKLHFVYGHDTEAMNALVADHVLEEKFK
jgi:glyoxylase-like metal-dependent hydrolase (beta-lactamase superfamily II)